MILLFSKPYVFQGFTFTLLDRRLVGDPLNCYVKDTAMETQSCNVPVFAVFARLSMPIHQQTPWSMLQIAAISKQCGIRQSIAFCGGLHRVILV